MEKIDALFDMVASIAHDVTEIKTGLSGIEARVNGIDTRLDNLDKRADANQRENNTRFDRIEQKLDVVVE